MAAVVAEADVATPTDGAAAPILDTLGADGVELPVPVAGVAVVLGDSRPVGVADSLPEDSSTSTCRRNRSFLFLLLVLS